VIPNRRAAKVKVEVRVSAERNQSSEGDMSGCV
jgi:hypothetical protein